MVILMESVCGGYGKENPGKWVMNVGNNEVSHHPFRLVHPCIWPSLKAQISELWMGANKSAHAPGKFVQMSGCLSGYHMTIICEICPENWNASKVSSVICLCALPCNIHKFRLLCLSYQVR